MLSRRNYKFAKKLKTKFGAKNWIQKIEAKWNKKQNKHFSFTWLLGRINNEKKNGTGGNGRRAARNQENKIIQAMEYERKRINKL